MNPKLEQKLAALQAAGLTYTATFVPQSASRNSAEIQPTLNWRVSLKRQYLPDMPVANCIAVDYTQGIGHLPKVSIPGPASGYYVRSLLAQREKQAAETGKAAERYSENMGGWIGAKPIVPPPLADVLYSLLLDGSASDEAFDDWCANFGYDTDSRKAEKTYDQCRDIGRSLERMFSRADLAELRELFSDY